MPVLSWQNPSAVVYGTALSGTQLNALADVAGTFAYTPAVGTILNAGSAQMLSVTFTPTDLANYAVVSKSVPISVNKASLTVKANSKMRGQNQENPTFDATYSGLVNGDTASSVGLVVNYATSGTLGAGAGAYSITPSGAPSTANYNVTYSPGTLTIRDTTPPVLSVSGNKTVIATSASGATVIYPAATATDNVTLNPTITYSKASGTVFPIGVTPVSVTASDEANNVSTATFTVTVSPMPVPVVPVAQSISFELASLGVKTFGDPPVLLGGSASSGLPVTYAVLSGSPARLESDGKTLVITGAGTVKVRASQAGNAGYKPAAVVEKSFVVRKKALSVSANDATRVVGSGNPILGISYSGFVGDETVDVLDKKPVATTTAKATSAAGNYPITVSGGLDNNYDFFYTSGALTVKGFGGTYEALLFSEQDEDNRIPVGKLEVTIPNNAMSYTGLLTLGSEAVGVKLSGGILSLEGEGNTVSGSLVLKNRKSGAAALPDLVVRLAVSEDTFEPSVQVGAAKLVSGNTAVETVGAGPFPHAGAYTMLISPPKAVDASDARLIPLGYGYATAKIDPKSGLLTLAGKLADGTALTGSYRPDANGKYRIFASPYTGRGGSYVGGPLEFKQTENGYAVSPDEGRLVWSKAAKSKDAVSYSQGFGPLESGVSVDRWQVPVAAVPKKNIPAVSLSSLLGLGVSGTGSDFAITNSGVSLGARASAFPSLAVLGNDNKTITLKSASAMKWTMTVDLLTGVFSGSFELSDVVPPATKPTLRAVSFAGALRQSGNGEPLIGGGFFMAAPLPGSSPMEASSGAIQLGTP